MQLTIDAHYYNKLDIEGFSRMMKDPSYCYKFYWLEAIVQLISESKTEATYDEIIDEMIANAWYSVLEFHIHLSGIWGDGGVKDNLERVSKRRLSQAISADYLRRKYLSQSAVNEVKAFYIGWHRRLSRAYFSSAMAGLK